MQTTTPDVILIDDGDDEEDTTSHTIILKQTRRLKLRIVDLFCGIGGFHCGTLMSLGLFFDITCVYACDIDQRCRNVYKTNFGCDPHGDILSLDEDDGFNEIPDHDLLFAGFPCQSFSSAGKRGGLSLDSTKCLVDRLLLIISIKSPAVCLLENVPNLISISGGSDYKYICDSLIKSGYTIVPMVLNTSEFNLPQNRRRLYILCIKSTLYDNYKNKDEFPTQQGLVLEQQRLFDVSPSIRKCLGSELYKKYHNDESLRGDPDKFVVFDKITWNRKLASGIVFCGLVNNNRKRRFDGIDDSKSYNHCTKNKVFHIDGVLCTMTRGQHSGYYIYDDNDLEEKEEEEEEDGEFRGIVRKLSVPEIYRIGGFPVNFIPDTSNRWATCQLGNAVCPLVVAYILSKLINFFYYELNSSNDNSPQ